MNAQEIFDTVARHLFAQGVRSMGPGGCAYRGAAGTRCAVGALIPDETYDPEMDQANEDGTGACRLVERWSDVLPDWFRANQWLLEDLQLAHDRFDSWDSTESMRRRLFQVASSRGLDASVLSHLRFEGR